jgi:uncharacterized lipoprotein YajG
MVRAMNRLVLAAAVLLVAACDSSPSTVADAAPSGPDAAPPAMDFGRDILPPICTWTSRR